MNLKLVDKIIYTFIKAIKKYLLQGYENKKKVCKVKMKTKLYLFIFIIIGQRVIKYKFKNKKNGMSMKVSLEIKESNNFNVMVHIW